MKVLFINECFGVGSHGKISLMQAREYAQKGDEVAIAYGRSGITQGDYVQWGIRISSKTEVCINALSARILDNEGFNARLSTAKFMKWADEYNPELVWLHNLHGYYINVRMLFDWIRSRPQMQVSWTLHDCWPFTGHCTNFNTIHCEKWKDGCSNCPQKHSYPKSILLDRSRANYTKRKSIFSGVEHMQLYTPSKWLADIVRQSFLNIYPIEVMPNPVDRSVFKPTPGDFRRRYSLEDKIIVLGVANAWQRCKGLYDLIELSRMLDERYRIVLVGLSEKQLKLLPDNMIGLKRTGSAKELAEIYTEADIFVNPSTEETFGMTTLEAALCGTRAIVYEGTACADVAAENGGIAVPANVFALRDAILKQSNESGIL